MNTEDFSIIIPAYNESETIGGIIEKIRGLYPDSEIIVVNDGSSDNTAAVANEAGAIVYSHPYNIGNGAAIKSGIRIASGEILVFMDGDGQHDPRDIAGMLELFPEYDMVVGSRRNRGQASFSRGIGNRILNWLACYVSKFRVEDLTSGFRAVKSSIARQFLYLLPNTYSYPTTLTLALLRDGRSVKYVPIALKDRESGQSEIRIIRDGLKFIMMITKVCTLYSPLRIFLPISFLLFMVGLIYYFYTYFMWERFTNMSALLFSTSVIIFMMGLVSEQVSQLRYERRDKN
ncbi:MAG: glycosyltransferase family 2 protein [Deltaproteobacteria bacterium]|nr:glycosyltransferase family 2 protein [Deltaproteobacteria bacterium]